MRKARTSSMTSLGILTQGALAARLLLSLLCQNAAAWTTVGDGIEYQDYTLADPNKVYVARMLRSKVNATLDSTFPNNKLSGGREIIAAQAARNDDAVNYWGQVWGQRNHVVVAINGGFTDAQAPPYLSLNGQCQSGWYALRMNDHLGGQSGAFGWTMDRRSFIVQCLEHSPALQLVSFKEKNATMQFQGINRVREANELVLYTPHYDSTTLTDSTGVEVVVQMTRPTMIQPSSDPARGYVRQIRANAGSTPIPFDSVVLSATGTAATTLLSNAVLGGEVSISQQITSYEKNCSTPRYDADWTRTYTAVAGMTVLKDSVIQTSDDPTMTNRNPRTAIAFNNTYIFYLVCDGRSELSVGMTGTELGTFCRDMLGATWAVNLDGGGSSTMIVNGELKNVPSDGHERAVGNGMLMLNILPRQQSSAHTIGQVVKITESANVRLGPGTNYAVLTSVPANSVGTLRGHGLAGVYAKGYYWWRVDLGNTCGWVAETLLADVAGAPLVDEQPVSQTYCAGDTLVFSLSASGPGPLSYQWRRNGLNLSDGGHYAGATTSTLTVSGADNSDEAGYRCWVSNASGAAISEEACITPTLAPLAPANAGETATTTSLTWRWSDVSGETGYRLKDGSGVPLSSDLPADTTQWIESGLTPNAPYTRQVCAFARCMESAGSTVRTRYPLAKAGISTDGTGATGNVWCTTAPVGSWYGLSKTFTFSNPAGFGISTPGGSEWRATGLEYKWNTSPTEAWGSSGSSWSSGAKSVTPNAGEGDYYLHVRAKNGNQNWNNTDTVDYGPFGIDTTPPTAVGSVTDRGTFTPSLTTLAAEWTPATDSGSGVVNYQYAVGTNPGDIDVKGWTDLGDVTSLNDLTISLQEGRSYFVQLRAVDRAGNTGPAMSSNGILAAPGVARITLLWPMANSIPLSLRNKIVTCAANGAFWLEEQNRTGAIKVVNASAVAPGSTVSVAGVLDMLGSQRVLFGDVVEDFGGNTRVGPLGMTARSLGGAAAGPLTPGVTDGRSAYNIGMLVRCWGTVTYADSTNPADRFFYLDDGSRLSDGSGRVGVKIRCGAASPPDVCGFATVDGVVDCEWSGGRVAPVLIKTN